MTTVIVTDSSADLSAELLSAYNIRSVPDVLIIDGQSYIDGEGITREEFYQRLPAMRTPPTTSSPANIVFEETYRSLFKQGAQHIISIHPPASLSGIFNSAVLSGKKFSPRVTVLDGGTISMGLGFQAIAAAEAARQGLTPEAIISVLVDVRRRLHVVAMLDSFEYVRRSGRVSALTASLGTFLQIKPFLGLTDGNITRFGGARTRQNGILRLYEHLKKLGRLERLAILHTNAEDDARQMLGVFTSQVKTQPLVVNVTSIIGTHVGPNGLGFAAVVE